MNRNGILLEIKNLTKSYGSVKVLDGVSLLLERSSILGLVGENGAGKSTLAKCVGGFIKPNSGTIRFSDPAAVVYTIPQEFNLIPALAVYENIFLGREKSRFGILKRSEMIAESQKLLRMLKSDVDPVRMTSTLSVAEKQMVEIAKAFLLDSNLIIMDEPTTVLNQAETEILFSIMNEFKNRGGAILYISHRLEEVRKICDNIAVLRDGVLAAYEKASTLTALEIAEKMVGRELDASSEPPDAPPEDAPEALRVEHLSSGNEVKDVSFTLKKGEILGIAGLAGAGRTELAETICALRKRSSGRVFLAGCEIHPKKPGDAMRLGLSYLSEDRQGTAVLPDFPIVANASLASLTKYCNWNFIRKNDELASAETYMERFRIKTQSARTRLRNLSGGNQQKVAIAKGLDTEPEVFIFDEPTRGVDVAARSEIYHFMASLAAEGVSCILISSDLEEIIGNCRRVLVMHRGSIRGELKHPEITEQEIMYLATGVKRQ